MNINQYKNVMDDIAVNKIELNELMKKSSEYLIKKKLIKSISIFITTIVLISILLPFNSYNLNNSNITIIAYAAGKEIQLTKDYIDVETSASHINGGYSSNYRFKNYNIYFKCNGKNIKSITYLCSDQPIDVSSRLNAPIYFVENISVPINEYAAQLNDSSFIFGYALENEGKAYITKLIGNSYTVNYDNQNDKQYGLVLASKINENGDFQITDYVIKLAITLTDGSIEHKKLIITSNNDNSGIRIRIID